MAARTFIDENNVMQIIYDNPEDIETTVYFKPGDPLYDQGIAGQMTINLPRFIDGKPEMFQKVVDIPILRDFKDLDNEPNVA